MAYAYKVVKVTAFGDCFNGAEEWSTGFFMGYADGDAAAPSAAFATAVKAAWLTFFTTSQVNISSSYKTAGIKLATLKTDGKTDLDSVITDYFTTPPEGTYGGAPWPAQCTVVAQLAASNNRGLAGKGRMYLPGIYAAVDPSTGKYSTTAAGNIATHLATFFNAINGSTDAPGDVINASQGRAVLFGAGPVNQRVASVRVGDVVDTQRRRRNGLVEAYSAATVTP